MPLLNNYLTFDGTCADAMRFYERTLGGKLAMMTHAQSPMAAQSPPGAADRIMHARLELAVTAIDSHGAINAVWRIAESSVGKG